MPFQKVEYEFPDEKTEEIQEIVVFSDRNGDITRLKDLAKVEVEFSDIPIMSYVNGKRSISFLIKNLIESGLWA